MRVPPPVRALSGFHRCEGSSLDLWMALAKSDEMELGFRIRNFGGLSFISRL